MSAPVIEWIRPGVGYEPSAAASMRRLEARLGRPHDCNSSYRDWDTQERMWKAWEAWVQRRGPRPPHSRAIHPKYSKHCQGLADDSDDWTTPGYIDLAEEHGWIRTAASDPTERHHFEYQWWRDQRRNTPAPTTPPASTTQSEEDDDMAVLVTGGGQNLIVGNKLIPLTNPAQVQSIKGAQVLEVSPDVHYAIIQAFARDAANAALPVLVYVSDGNGTVYLLQSGKLEALVDPKTLATLHAQGAASVTLSQAEVTNLLAG